MPYYDHGLLKPYVIFDVAAGRDAQQGGGGSRFNLAEVNMALALFQELHAFMLAAHERALREGGPLPPPCLVGVIAPYRCAAARPTGRVPSRARSAAQRLAGLF